jgi:predicted nicotinamide N-methyase
MRPFPVMTADSSSSSPHLPETPVDALTEIIREEVFVDDRTFIISRPDESFGLLDHPYAKAAFNKDEYMPYWTDLWPAARMMAKIIARSKWPEGLTALEIGCGLGLPGVVALSKGLHVIFSDYDATAVRFAARNAELNGFTNFRTLQMDWRFPPQNLQVPLVLAADLIYERRNVTPVVQLIKKVLEPEGEALLADQDRIPARVLTDALTEEKLVYKTEVVRAGEPAGKRVKGTLYRIQHARTGG